MYYLPFYQSGVWRVESEAVISPAVFPNIHFKKIFQQFQAEKLKVCHRSTLNSPLFTLR